MGRGGHLQTEQPVLTWQEVKKHTDRNDKWIVIDGKVYDITQWSRRHPGGSRVISHFAGQDATEAFQAFHNDLNHVKKYLKPIHVGEIDGGQSNPEEIKEDFEKLRQTVKKMGLFRPSITFYILSILELIVLEAAAYYIMCTFGTGWIPWIIAVLLHTTVQAQAGWIQHDYGHLSVFQSSKWNHLVHQYTMCFTKGASCDWWNHLHYQHHAKPNVLHKDPDVRLEALFVLGETMPKRVAKEKKKSMPYNWQHRYFFVLGPPLLFPIYFQYMVIKHPFVRKNWLDLAVMCLYYIRFFSCYFPLLGLPGALFFYFIIRCAESHWFVWVSQSNHIPMDIDDDKALPWLPLQLNATCNVEKSWFNDWFTGHLNFQVEHHLFPTMPRHNLYKTSALVKSLCEKHNIPYVVKPLMTAFRDVVGSLKHSGQIWAAYYHAYHLS
jgi:fatty acid desaturase 2 (delta-6 desaturase)